MYLKVAGVTYENRQEIIKNELNIGDEVRLIREINNKFDPYAVRVETSNGKQIGYVSQKESKNVTNQLINNFLFGEVVAIRGFSEGENYGVAIQIDTKKEGRSLSTSYNGRNISYDCLKYKVIDNDKKSPYWYTHYTEVALAGFSNKSIKNVKVESNFKTFWKKIFSEDGYCVRAIRPRSFVNNSKIEYIDFKSCHLEVIGEESFLNCSSLKTLLGSSNQIEKSAFENCVSLENATITATSIQDNAFKNCKSLINFNLNNNKYLNYIGPSVFEDCESLQKIDLAETSLSKISKRTFAGCKALKEIILPHTVNLIETEAFSDCISLEKVVVKGEVYRIEKNAFKNCINLKSIVFEDNINSIQTLAFDNCNKLDSVKFKKQLYILEEKAFLDCKNLINIEVNIEKSWLDNNSNIHESYKSIIKPTAFKRKTRIITDPDEALRLIEEANAETLQAIIDKYSY